MRCIVKEIEHSSRSDVFRIVPLGDVHVGAAACDERLFREKIAYIRDTPGCFWIGMGDMADAIVRNDKRFDEETTATWLWGTNKIVQRQREFLCDELAPIGPKCLAYLIGNHELKIDHEYSSDIYLDVIEAIRPTEETALRMEIGGFLILKFRRSSMDERKGGTCTITFYLHHGWGGGDTMGGTALKLERLPESYEADIYMMGHTHKKIAIPGVIISAARNGKVLSRSTYEINTGSFLKTGLPNGVTYSELTGKKPLALGPAEIVLTPGAENERVKVMI